MQGRGQKYSPSRFSDNIFNQLDFDSNFFTNTTGKFVVKVKIICLILRFPKSLYEVSAFFCIYLINITSQGVFSGIAVLT